MNEPYKWVNLVDGEPDNDPDCNPDHNLEHDPDNFAACKQGITFTLHLFVFFSYKLTSFPSYYSKTYIV